MVKNNLTARNQREGWVLILPLLLGCGIFFAAPFLLVLRNSLFNGIGYSEHFVGLENYKRVLESAVFRLAFSNTLKFLALALPLVIVISYGIAMMLREQAEKYEVLKSVLLLPYIMPVAGTVLMVDLLFLPSGIVNEILKVLDFSIAEWLNSRYAYWVVILLYLWKNTGYSVILILSGLVTIPEDQYHAAALDGADQWQRFISITMPQMWYSLFFAFVFSLINAFKCFREIFLIGGTHPHSSIYMLQHFINNAFQKLNYPKLSVASVLLFLVIAVIFACLYSFVTGKEAYKE